MPVFRITYRTRTETGASDTIVCVQAKNAEAAATVVRTHLAAKGVEPSINEIEKVGFLVGAKAARAARTATPSWVSADGKVRPLSKMKVRNLRTLERKFAACDFGLGLLSALREELGRRGESVAPIA